MNNSSLQYALHYASLGIPVLPLHYIRSNGVCSCGGSKKNPACKPGKHPCGNLVPHGVIDASTDSKKMYEWFNANPYNIGIATGAVSKFFVLDRDDKDGGNVSLENWEAENSRLPDTLVQRTGNGIHYAFKMPDGIDVRNSQKKLAPGIDIRGTGGYICAAPAIHENGKQYEWIGCDFLDINKILEPPAWLIEKILATTKKTVSRVSTTATSLMGCQFSVPENVDDGEGREATILSYAGHLRGKGLDQVTIERTLLDYNKLHVNPSLDDEVVLDRARRYQNNQIQDKTSADINTSWPEPQKLQENLPRVPQFDTRLLSDLVGKYVQDVAERSSCPVDFPAVAAVVSLAAALGSRIHCKPYNKNPWLVPAGAWGIIVNPPGSIKSPPVSEVLHTLYEMDKNAAKQYDKKMEQYQITKAIYDNEFKVAVKKGNATIGLAPPVEPIMTRYIVNDSTYEMLVAIAAANPNGFLVWHDELVGWFHSLNKENQKEARGLYLTGWSGTESYATDRIGRGHVRANRVNLSLLGTIQPNVLKHIVHDAVAGGSGDDGLVARFQLAVYPDSIRTFEKVDRAPNIVAKKHYCDLIQKFATLDPATTGALITHDGNAYLLFDEEAQLIFDTWREKLEKRIRDPNTEEHPAMLAHLAKYRSLFPKLALVFHLADGCAGLIRKNAAIRAKCWTIYLEAHARRIYHTATNRTMQSSIALAKKIKAGRLNEGFTKSNVLLKEWSGLRTAEEVSTALTVLRDMNWLRMIEDRSTGGRPAEHFYINPKVKRAA